MANPYDDVVDSWQREQGNSVAPASSNPYDAVVGQMQQERQQAVRSVFEKALATNPDVAAENKRLADTTGLSLEMVERNKDEIQRKQQARMLDLARMAQDSPVLARQLVDPTFTKQTHDHLDNLSALEQTFNVARALPAGAASGLGSAITGLGTLIDVGARATGLTAVSKIVRDTTGADLGIALDVAGSLKFVGGGWKMLGDAIGPAPEDKNFLTDVSGGIGQLVQQIGVQIATGGSASLLSLFSQGADSMNEKVKGDNSSQALKDTAIIAGASITALTEKYGVDALLNRVPPAIKNNALRWVADKMAAAGIEATQELTEGALTDIVRVLLTNSDAKIGENVAYEAGVAGTSAAIVRAALGVRVRSNAEIQQQRVAEADAGRLQEQFQLASGALLRERNPEQFRALVQSMTEQTEGAPTEIYVDAQVLNQLAPEVLAQLPGVAEQMQAALAANDVVSISMADVLTVAPGTPLEQMLVENARIGDVTAMSQLEAKEAGAKAQEYLAQESARVIQQAVDQQAMQESSDRVKQGVLDQLNTVGRFRKEVNEGYATWTAAFYTTMAGRLGVTPEQMQAKYPLRITGQTGQGGVLNAMEQTQTPEFKTFFGTSKMVDGEGKPLRMFHATNKSFDTFNPSFRGAFFVTPDVQFANDYLDNSGQTDLEEGANVMPVYVRAENPFDYENPEHVAQIIAYLQKTGLFRGVQPGFFEGGRWDSIEDRQVQKAIKALGFDSFYVNENDVKNLGVYSQGQIKSATGNNGNFDRTNPNILNQSVTTQVSTLKGAVTDPSIVKVPGIAEATAPGGEVQLGHNTELFGKNEQIVAGKPKRGYDSIILPAEGTPAEKAEAVITQMVRNLHSIFDAIPEAIRQRSKLWYDGANRISLAFAERYDLTPMQTAAQLAVTSPQADWRMNVSYVERINDILERRQDHTWDAEMDKWAKDWINSKTQIEGRAKETKRKADALKIATKDEKKAVAFVAKKQAIVDELTTEGADTAKIKLAAKEVGKAETLLRKAQKTTAEKQASVAIPDANADIQQYIVGKKLSELTTDEQRAWWVRSYDEAHHDRGFRDVSPEGGFLDMAKTDSGKNDSVAWKSFNAIAKAISIHRDGSIENVHAQLGGEHKVRNFYNNIYAPNSPSPFVTSDTHQVAANLFLPLGADALEVGQNFGGTGTKSVSDIGLNGTYWYYSEAVKRAAEQRGVLPREMQSISWEAIRSLFSATFKSDSTKVNAVRDMWVKYQQGIATYEDTINAIVTLAGGYTPPTWVGVRPDSARAPEQGNSSYQNDLAHSRQGLRGRDGSGPGNAGVPGTNVPDGRLNQNTQLLAPNGKPSNLTPALHALVRTTEFKAWFGDWEAFAGMQGGVWSDTTNSVSKAVDENGEPLVVYHGTKSGGFQKFKKPTGERRGDLGIFLTPDRAMAQTYVTKNRPAGDITRDMTGTGEGVAGVYPLFANIRNPNEAGFEGANWDGTRVEQFQVMDQGGEQIYTEDGRGYLSEQDAQALAEANPGATVEAAQDHFESTDSVVREARQYKNDGAIIRDVMDDGGGVSSYAGEAADVFVAFDPAQVKAVDNFGSFNPNNSNIYQQGPRGTFSPVNLELALNDNADLSTFLHETGHFFLEVMADLAAQTDAPADVQQDMAELLKWFGVADLATWNNYTLDEKRPYHERFAESFEQYLLEGKAPSIELQPLFRKFRAWMLNAYKSLKAFVDSRQGATEIQLSDEVRQVFDRMIASEEQITQAEQVAGLLPDYDATNEAIEKLTARSLRDLKWTVNARAKIIKDLQKQAADLRKGVEAEVRAEVEQQPIYRAMQWLRKGEMLDEAGNLVKAEKGFRLATEVLGEMFPETMLARPDLTRLKGMTVKGGLHPDLVADMFGFESGDTLVRNLIDAEPLASVVEGITDQRMLEQHGDLIDQRAIEAAANEAVHNEARARSLASELRSQAEALNPRTDTGQVNAKGSKITVNAIVEAAKQFAANVVASTPLRDLKAKAWQHTAAERRAGKRWQEHTAKGETQDAVKAKQDQVLNNAAAKAAVDAQAEMRKILTFFKRVIKDNNETTVDKGRDPDVVNAARAILGAYGIAPKGAKTAAEYMDLVAKNDPAMFAALQPSVQGALNMAQPLDALTMEELRGLHEEIQAMWHLAKRSRQMEVDGNLMDMQDAEDELQSRMQEIGVPATMPGEASAITSREKASRALQFAGSLLRRAEQWAEGMGSEFTKLVFQPVKDAANAYRADRAVYRKAYQALVDNVAPALIKGEINAPELGYTFGKGHNGIGHAELLHAILHTGNASNKRKLLLGREWATENADGTMDTSKWDAFLSRMHDTGVLNKAHYDFAQGVWDLLEKTKPLAQKTHRDVFGRYFAEVTADSFTTPFGDYAGGYVPAQADPRIVQDAALRDLATSENENMAFSFPGTNKGFTKGRVEYNRPLMLDLRTIGQHIDKVLLFSHMEPAVRDVNKLLSRKGVSYSLGRIDPTIYAGMLTPWLNRSARQIVETPIVGDGGISRVLSAARSRAGMALMFGNVSNALQQTTGFLTAMSKLKSDGLDSQMLRATAQFIASPKQTAKAVADASPFMATRMENEISAINDAMDQILLDPNLYDKAQAWTQKHAYFLQTALANSMEPIIWTAGYNAALEKGLADKEAVRYADGLIRQTQGSTLPEDVSRLETGPAYARVFTQFIGYFNMMANTNATGLKQVAAEMGLKKGAGKAIGIVTLGALAPIWMAEAIAQAMRGGPDDEDKDGYLDDWLMVVFGMGTIKGTLAMVPFVGQLGNAAINRFNGNPADDKMSLSPAVSLLEAAVGVPVDIYKAITDPDKLNRRNAVRDVASAISIATGLPAVAIARPLGYLAGVDQGKIDPTSAADAARGLLTGTPSPGSK